MTPTNKKLRFAPIIRVSTELQERQGESLRAQTTQIKRAVEQLGGTIPDHCWQYSGQEHATASYERAKLNKLLEDCKKDLFDAVIVVDPSRWSRDNIKSEIGLNILRDADIRFFVGAMEYNLRDPQHRLYLGLNAAMNQFQASNMSKNSLLSKIERAKRGIPSIGKLPYGRTFDREALKRGADPADCWGLDDDKVKIIKVAAKRYLAGEGFEKLALAFGINEKTLYTTLTKRAGTEWEINFTSEKMGIDETVVLKVPRLLDEKTIKAIHEQVRKNIKSVRGHRKNQYLLSGYIFCSHCGYSLNVYSNRFRTRYYIHRYNVIRDGKCPRLKKNIHIPANELENSVLIALVQTFGDPEKIEKAIQKTTPDFKKRKKLEKEKEYYEQQLSGLEIEHERLLEAVSKGLLTDSEIEKSIEKIRKRKLEFETWKSQIECELNNIPKEELVKRKALWARSIAKSVTVDNPNIVFKRDYEWKRRLIERAFSGTDARGNRLGVYISIDKNDQMTMEIKGMLEPTVLSFPLSEEYLWDRFHLDPEYCDVDAELDKIRERLKSNIVSI